MGRENMKERKLRTQIKSLEKAQSALKLGAQQIITELHNERGKCDLLALALEKALIKGTRHLTKEERHRMDVIIWSHRRERGYKQ